MGFITKTEQDASLNNKVSNVFHDKINALGVGNGSLKNDLLFSSISDLIICFPLYD